MLNTERGDPEGLAQPIERRLPNPLNGLPGQCRAA
jgi:hypothetical protein